MGVVYEMIQLYSHLSVSIQGSKFSFGFGSPCLLNVNAFEKTIVHHAITDNCVSSTSCTSPVSLPWKNIPFNFYWLLTLWHLRAGIKK